MNKQLFFLLILSSSAFLQADSLYHKVLHAPCTATKALLHNTSYFLNAMKKCPYVGIFAQKKSLYAGSAALFLGGLYKGYYGLQTMKQNHKEFTARCTQEEFKDNRPTDEDHEKFLHNQRKVLYPTIGLFTASAALLALNQLN